MPKLKPKKVTVLTSVEVEPHEPERVEWLDMPKNLPSRIRVECDPGLYGYEHRRYFIGEVQIAHAKFLTSTEAFELHPLSRAHPRIVGKGLFQLNAHITTLLSKR